MPKDIPRDPFELREIDIPNPADVAPTERALLEVQEVVKIDGYADTPVEWDLLITTEADEVVSTMGRLGLAPHITMAVDRAIKNPDTFALSFVDESFARENVQLHGVESQKENDKVTVKVSATVLHRCITDAMHAIHPFDPEDFIDIRDAGIKLAASYGLVLGIFETLDYKGITDRMYKDPLVAEALLSGRQSMEDIEISGQDYAYFLPFRIAAFIARSRFNDMVISIQGGAPSSQDIMEQYDDGQKRAIRGIHATSHTRPSMLDLAAMMSMDEPEVRSFFGSISGLRRGSNGLLVVE